MPISNLELCEVYDKLQNKTCLSLSGVIKKIVILKHRELRMLKRVSLIQLFLTVKNRRAHQNTAILFISQKQTDNPKELILSTKPTEKMQKSNIRHLQNLKIMVIF